MKNKLILFALLATGTCGAFADDADGGFLAFWPKDHGKFVFVNSQNTVDAKFISRRAAEMCHFFNFDITFESLPAPDIRSVPDVLKKMDAKGAIWFVDDPAMPITIGACEDGWGFVNVAKIVADKPDEEKLATRIEKIVNRLFAHIHGIGDPITMPQCVMKPAVGLEGIDALPCRQYSPMSMMTVSGYMRKAGYKSKHEGSYLEACEDGWAPAPTNDVQRAIWNKVHAMPTNPIRIKPGDKPKSKR